jgi:integrating conjugative element protein (TIGR03749 family)
VMKPRIGSFGRWVALCCLLACGLAMPATARTLVWDKTVIELEMVVGVEQILLFPSDAAVGLPASLANKAIFRTLFTGGTAYWTALQAFERQRIKVRLDSGEYVLFDVSARMEKAPPPSVERLQIVFPGEGDRGQMADGTTSGPANVSGHGGQATVFEMVRYAAQDIYSPARLVAALPGVRNVPVGITGNQNRLYDQGNHKGLVILPYKAWSVDGLYVTGFVVTNGHSHSMTLDNRKVMHTAQTHRNGVGPHFLASVFYKPLVAKRGEPGDRTTLFVVTDRPIASVIRR